MTEEDTTEETMENLPLTLQNGLSGVQYPSK